MLPVSSLPALKKALASVPGGQARSTVSYVHTGGKVVVEAETSDGRRLMTASPVGKNRYAVKVENFPSVNGQNNQVNSTVEFTASSKWVNEWKELAHERSLNGLKTT